MDNHHIIAALGVGVGIIAAFVVWTYVSPVLTSASR